MLQPFVETCVGDSPVFIASRLGPQNRTLQISDLKGKPHLQQHNTFATSPQNPMLRCFMRSTHFHHVYVESQCGILLMLIACPGAIAASQRTIQLRSLPNCGGNQRAWKSMSTRCPPDWLYRLYAPRRLATISFRLIKSFQEGFPTQLRHDSTRRCLATAPHSLRRFPEVSVLCKAIWPEQTRF